MAGNFFQTKAAARQSVEGVRRSLSSAQVSEWGGEVQRHLAASGFLRGVIALYDAQPFEVPLRIDGGLSPRLTKGSRVLSFHRAAETDFVKGPMGLREPGPQVPSVALSEIDVWLIPGVAFTPSGDRLGRGGGYYDATLALARADSLKIGVAFECCVVAGFPTEAHDVKVEWLVTERGLRRTTFTAEHKA
jgi:5-formyltetrahydrofolate cyclo-ligase